MGINSDMQFTVYNSCFCDSNFSDYLLFVSGLNLQSQFNLDNVTVFNKNEQESTLGQKVKC